MRRWSETVAIAALCTIAGAALAQPANDHCSNPQIITDGDWPYDLTGADTDGVTSSAVAELMEEETQDVWFQYTATATGVLNAVTCTDTFSSSVAIYAPGCTHEELASGWIGAPEGPCPFSFAGDASVAVVQGQTVIIKVAVALFGPPAPAVLHVEVRPAATSCVVVPPGAVDEGEPCGSNFNDDCSGAFQISSYPSTISGQLAADFPTLDEDWYHIHADSPQLIRATLSCDLPTMYMTLYSQGPGECVSEGFNVPIVGRAFISERCETGVVSAYVGPGDYYISLLPDTAVGYPCDTVNRYVLQVESTPVGACCMPGGCSIMTQAACTTGGGTYQGDASICGAYATAASTSAYEDISATGTAGPESTLDGPENNLVVDVGFDFEFYGNTFDEVSISTNGFLQFGDAPLAGAPFNGPIPSVTGGTPRNAIFGLWDALVTLVSVNGDEFYNGSGNIVYQTLGTAPNRRFIAQWINVGQQELFPMAPEGIPVNFQIVLFETSNTIELRYGTLTLEPGDSVGSGYDYTIGVQDALGLNATNVDSFGIGIGNTAVLLAYTNNCDSTCDADLDNGTGSGTPDGGVDINDLLYFLTGFESGSVAVDLDNGTSTGTPDGGVDINDLLYFLVRFEAGC